MLNESPIEAEDIAATVEQNVVHAAKDRFIKLFAHRFLQMESVGVLIMDAQFRIVEMSGQLCTLLGIIGSGTRGCVVEDWFHDQLRCAPPFDRSLLGGNYFSNRRWSLVWGGNRCEYMLDGEALEEEGQTVGAFVVFRDVSKQVMLEEQIRQSDRLKTIGQIAAGTAHEIRNPLTSIKGFMQLMKKALIERGMERELKFADVILSELGRVNSLLDEFLLLSKPKEAKRVSISIRAVLKELLPMIRNEALLHRVEVRYQRNTDLKHVLADSELLKQVYLNLCKNGIEAMNKGGTLRIRERLDALRNRVGVEISDTGGGIAEDKLAHIFEPFFTTKAQGTGLGLSVCQNIIHELDGEIEVVSNSGGASFIVWLPCEHVVE